MIDLKDVVLRSALRRASGRSNQHERLRRGNRRRLLASAFALMCCALFAGPAVSSAMASKSFACGRLVSVAYMKSVTGLRPIAAAANARQKGAKVTCMVTFLPGMPRFAPNGPLKFTVSARSSDVTQTIRRYGPRLVPFPGLGRSLETVSALRVITITSVGRGFVLRLVSEARRVDPQMTEAIAKRIFASASR